MSTLFAVRLGLPATAVPIGPQAAALAALTKTSGNTTPFIVSSVTRAEPTLPPNLYTGRHSLRAERYWRVTCSFALIKDRSVDFYFDQEADARQFAKMGVHSIPELFKGLDPVNAAFVSLGIGKAKRQTKPNLYTGRDDQEEQWHALLYSDQYGRYADLWFESQQAASQYGTGTAVTLPELLLPLTSQVSVPYYPQAQYPNRANAAVSGQGAAADPAAIPTPPDILGPLVLYKLPVVFYPAATYAAEIYYTGGFVDIHGIHTGFWPGGKRAAGYNFGSGVYFDDQTNTWVPLALTPSAVTPAAPPGPQGLGTAGFVQAVAGRKNINGVLQWVILYLIH